jgi:hypothetical protein
MARNVTHPSPRAAMAIGLVVMACGVAPILGALQIIPVRLTPGTPVWVGVAAGGIFILGGLALINGYVLGGGRNFATEAPAAVRRVQTMLGFAICALFAGIGSWIAFGSGDRQFSSTIDLPFWHSVERGNELFGRAAFGLGALIAAAMALLVVFRSK